MTPSNNKQFNQYYSLHCKHLKLKGLQPKPIDAYTRAIRRIGEYFDYEMDNLSHNQLLDYFHDLLGRLSWSALFCQTQDASYRKIPSIRIGRQTQTLALARLKKIDLPWRRSIC